MAQGVQRKMELTPSQFTHARASLARDRASAQQDFRDIHLLLTASNRARARYSRANARPKGRETHAAAV
jgi:hypothetical protein